MRDFVLKCPVRFIFSLEVEFRERRLMGLDVRNTVTCQVSLLPAALVDCLFRGRSDHDCLVPNIKDGVHTSKLSRDKAVSDERQVFTQAKKSGASKI